MSLTPKWRTCILREETRSDGGGGGGPGSVEGSKDLTTPSRNLARGVRERLEKVDVCRTTNFIRVCALLRSLVRHGEISQIVVIRETTYFGQFLKKISSVSLEYLSHMCKTDQGVKGGRGGVGGPVVGRETRWMCGRNSERIRGRGWTVSRKRVRQERPYKERGEVN